MPSSSSIAAIRFGAGLSPASRAPVDAAALMAELSAPDHVARDFPVAASADIWDLARQIYAQGKAMRANTPGAAEAHRALQQEAYATASAGLVSLLLRGQAAPTGFRERLQDFWSDHFTVVAANAALYALPTAMAEEAIRPNIATTFPQMLRAVITHPAMLVYLNQNTSFGPNSPAGKRQHKGLNENLGREVLELHTLGVGAAYTQTDVRQMAFLLTGLTVRPDTGFTFAPGMVEPMTEVVLGHRYGGPPREKLSQIYLALDEIALRPETAQHVCTKLATYFVADQPDKGLVAAMVAAYRAGDGALLPVYRAMLDHPAARAPLGAKVRRPFDFVMASVRALQPPAATLKALDRMQVNRLFAGPMANMGQAFQRAAGPNGWPEAAAAWIQPQFLAARIQWAMAAPVALHPDLPDPRDFVQVALAEAASPATRQAAMRAESRREGIGLILASNDFNRR
ncbi:MAG: DUF1800 domain-containing protein [Paracoccaceae bacterium]|nr:DUF1800 domain-containing protein [Paracoccaceae bacterium]